MIERLPSSAYAPRTGLTYIDSRKLFPLFEKIAFRSNLILVGPKGVGKSLAVAAFAAEVQSPIITFDCSEDIRRSQLLGMFILRGNETPFVLGPLTSAIEVANDVGRCILVLEELNSLSPQAQKILNGLTDWRRSIEVPEAKQVFRLNPGAELWVVGTMNFSAYGGVYQLNEDLKSRFRMLALGYPSPAEEKKILKELVPAASANHLDQLQTLAKETRQSAMDYPLSTRDLVQILEDIQSVGIQQALRLIGGKYEDEARKALSKRIDSIFGLKDFDR